MNTEAADREAPARRRGLSPLLNLCYLLNLLWSPVFGSGTWLDWLLVAGITVVFVPLYLAVVRRPRRVRWTFIVPVTVLGALTTAVNSGAAVLFVYAAASAGLHESRRNAVRWFAGLTVLTGLFAVVSVMPMPWRLLGLGWSLVFVWLVGLIQIEQADKEREAAEERMRNARIEHLAVLSERERIARDLHDLLGHSLTAVVMRAQLVEQLVEADPARAKAEAVEIESTARDALASVRAAVTGWRHASLDAELESARRALASAGVELVVRRDPELTIVGSAEHELALALREAATNVARHARARTCRVIIGAQGGELRLTVADDGIGGDGREGNGLTGMRERITALGGRLVRTGTAGTTVTIAVPLKVAT